MITRDLPMNPAVQSTYALDHRPGFFSSFASGFMEGLETTSIGIAVSQDSLNQAELGTPMSKAEWEASEYRRDGLAWVPEMTTQMAEILAHRRDRQEARAFAQEDKGIWGKVLGVAGNFIGSIPDPVNFIPILGQAARAAAVAKIGKVAGTAAVMAGEAAIGSAAMQPFLASEMKAHQDPYDWEMAASNILIAAGIGATIGAGQGWFTRTPTTQHVTATAKALSDVMDGKAVDVASVMPVEDVEAIARQAARGYIESGGGSQMGPLSSPVTADARRLADNAIAVIADLESRRGNAQGLNAQQQLDGIIRRARSDAENQITESLLPFYRREQADMAVAPRQEPIFPETQPTTAKNVFEPVAADEVDFSPMEKRYAEMEAQGLIDSGATAELEAVKVQKETMTMIAKAYELAANCLVRTD